MEPISYSKEKHRTCYRKPLLNKGIQLLKVLVNFGFKEHLEINLICPLQGFAFNSLKYGKVKGISFVKKLWLKLLIRADVHDKAKINFSSQE